MASLMVRVSHSWFNPFLLLAPCAGMVLTASELLLGHLFAVSIWALLVPTSVLSLLQLPTLAATMFAHVASKQTLLSQLAIATFVALGFLLFVIHPIGNTIWFYPLLWLPIISSLASNSFFIRAWAMTLSAHMVGTILFIYTHATTTAYWMHLMPIAFVERLCSALVLCLVMYSISFIMRYTKAAQNIGNVNASIFQI
jgi:hypothetical protein